MNKKIIISISILLVSSAFSFYVGAQYAQKNAQTTALVTSDAPQVGFRQGGAAGGRQRTMGGGAGFTSGKILSKTEQSIVVELRDGGSKIIFVSPSSEISKFVLGSAADLEVGKNVSVSGEANPDGSVNAKTIQLRPDLPQGFNRTGQTAPTGATN